MTNCGSIWIFVLGLYLYLELCGFGFSGFCSNVFLRRWLWGSLVVVRLVSMGAGGDVVVGWFTCGLFCVDCSLLHSFGCGVRFCANATSREAVFGVMQALLSFLYSFS